MFTSKSGGLSWDLSLQLVCFCRRVTFTHDKVVVQPPVLLVSWSPHLRYIKLGKGRLFSAVHSTIIKLRFSCNSLGAAVGWCCIKVRIKDSFESCIQVLHSIQVYLAVVLGIYCDTRVVEISIHVLD